MPSDADLLALLGLIVAGTALLAMAPRLHVPYPILLVLGGLALGFMPNVPDIQLDPEVVLIGFLPPLLYSGAFFTSLRDLRANARPIGLLAVGLVVLTMAAVAVVAHEVAGLDWAQSFVLGAIVSPTDPIAATSIFSRLGVPARGINVIEGESLVNDGTALVAYRFAVVAVVTGVFDAGEVALTLVWAVVGGVAIGLGVGWLVRRVRRRIDNPPVEITIALMTGYFAFIPAEIAGASAVLAVVTAGVYVGWHTPELTTFQTRLQGDAVWAILTFVLNAALFGLVGLQLSSILDGLGDSESAAALLGYAAAVVATVIVVRLIWVFPAAWIPRRLSARLRERDPLPPWQYLTLLGWSGMRGAVSLAAALAIPLTTAAGDAFADRDLIIFLTFSVILGTLVLQGLTMPALIRFLGLEDDGVVEREAVKARIHAAEAALARIEELAGEDWVRDDTAERLRGLYTFRRGRFVARFDDQDDGAIEERSAAYQQLLKELLQSEREAVLALRRAGRIGDDAMRQVQRELDFEEARLDLA